MSKTKPQTKTSVIPSSDSSAVSPVSFALQLSKKAEYESMFGLVPLWMRGSLARKLVATTARVRPCRLAADCTTQLGDADGSLHPTRG